MIKYKVKEGEWFFIVFFYCYYVFIYIIREYYNFNCEKVLKLVVLLMKYIEIIFLWGILFFFRFVFDKEVICYDVNCLVGLRMFFNN